MVAPIDKYEPMIDLDADIPRWKKIIGLYPRYEQSLGGEAGDSETEKDGGVDDQSEDFNDEYDGDFDDDITPDDDEDLDQELDDYLDELLEEGRDNDDEEESGQEIQEIEEDSQEPDLPGYELAPAPKHRKELPPLDNRTFDSWHEFVESAIDESLVGWRGYRSSREVDSDPLAKKKRLRSISDLGLPWHGTDTWEECVLMATRTGWPEGRKMLEESLAVVRPRPEPFRSIEMSVAGAFPMVPNYCAGDPECMVIDPGSDLRHIRPIVRIDFNNWTHAGVKPEDMMLRGAAVISLAETLEQHGYSTELRVVGNSKAWDATTAFRYSIVYKKAGELLDLDSAAFAIAHPACMRRLCFAILEQHADAEAAYHSTYGSCMYQPNDSTSGKPGGAIYVNSSKGYETKEIAREAVNEAAKDLLTEISIAEEQGND